MERKTVSIIITYNPALADFREVLFAHLKTGVNEILIVDNNSQNKTGVKEILEEINTEGRIRAFFLDDNYGIGYAQNYAIEIARQSDCFYVVLFDQDSIVPAQLVENLIKADLLLSSKNIKVGAVGPVYNDPRTQNYYPLARVNGIKIENVWPNTYTDSNINVSFLIASGSLIRMTVLNDVGLMNEDLFIDCVDIEWCFRAAAKGYSFFANKDCIISHAIGDERKKSLGREISVHSPLRKYYMTRNNLLIFRFKWIPLGYRIRILLITIFRTPIYLYDMKFDAKYIKYTLNGLYDGLLNKSGSYKR